jgi:protein-S-isoprenylcysteine O-methyltransferase Ste14
MLLFSISIFLGDWVIFVYSLVGTIVFRYLVIPAEEEKLITAFGEEYEEYQSRTGALIPKLR